MSRYSTPGVSKVFWAPTITLTAPTAVQVNAGLDITSFLRNLPDLPRQLQTVDIANLSSKYDARQVGTRGGDTLTLNILRDNVDDDAYDGLVEDDEGYLVVFRQGTAGATPAASDLADIYPAAIGAVADGTPGRNEPDFAVVSVVASADPVRKIALV